MAIRKPASFVAGRRIVLNGAIYLPGAAVPNAVVKTIKRLDALLSCGKIVSNLDPYNRKKRAGTTSPVSFNPATKAAL